MKIGIVGSRGFFDIWSPQDHKYIRDFAKELFVSNIIKYEFTEGHQYRSDIPILISGGAKGIDTFAEEVVDHINKSNDWLRILKTIYPADWKKYGKKAGFLRNKQIVEDSEKVLAFWDGKSKGTKISIDLAIEKGIPIDIYIRK